MEKKDNKKLIFMVLILFFLLSVFVYLISLDGLLAWDEPVYLANARDKIGVSYFSEDFRFPLLSALIAGVWIVTGESVLVAQLFVVLLSLLAVLAFFFVSRYFLDDWFSLVAAGLFGFSLQFITWGFRIYTDILGILLVLLSFLFLLKHDETYIMRYNQKYNIFSRKGFLRFINNYYLVFLSGLFAGLAFSARLSTIIISFVLFSFFLLKKNWFKNILSYGVGFFIAVLPWLIHGFLTKGNPLYFALAQTSAILEYTLRESPMILMRHLMTEFGLALLFILVNVFYFLHVFSKSSDKPLGVRKLHSVEFKKVDIKRIVLLLLILFAQLLFYFYFVKLKLARYLLELAPFIILLILLGANAIIFLTKKKYQRFVSVFLIIFISTFILLPSMIGLGALINIAECTSDGAARQSIDLIDELSVPGQVIVSSIWPYHGYYSNLRAFSPWTDDLDDLFESHNPDFLAFSDSAGIPFTGVVDRDDVVRVASFVDECGWDMTVYKVIKE
jgi:4-amino-4-deoxy-L-arabinose transferase-like glycosyltransferase